jgi:hypothetical protein
MISDTNTSRWSELLTAAVNQPGMILKAYSAFHGYSLGNRILALMQCSLRGIEPGPINTYVGWQTLNRQVRKGEKALTLCMPLARNVKDESGNSQQVITNFIYKPRWFVLSQTDGEDYQLPPMPGWDKGRALASLSITEEPFTDLDGNTQGYAKGRSVAISPVAALPHKTLMHELAHIELGHTSESDFNDTEHTPRKLREVEAESVALLVLDSLELEGASFCRGYIQGWLKGDVIPERSAQKIFAAADRILKAGREKKESVN